MASPILAAAVGNATSGKSGFIDGAETQQLRAELEMNHAIIRRSLEEWISVRIREKDRGQIASKIAEPWGRLPR